MSIRDEARAEAERRWYIDHTLRPSMAPDMQEAFVKGAVWASEQADREREAMREQVSEVLMGMYDHGTLPNALREADYLLERFDIREKGANLLADREPSDAETIEHVARAIQAAHKPKDTEVPAWEYESAEWRETYRDFARAALLAAQEVKTRATSDV